MKEIKDYLHLYLGCELQRGGIVTGGLLDAANDAAFDAWSDLKPILRPFSDMTDGECLKLGEILGGMSHLSKDSVVHQIKYLFFGPGYYNKQTNIHGYEWTEAVNYLRKIHIDCDYLIDSGLAIDKTKH